MAITKQRIKKLSRAIEENSKYNMIESIREVFREIAQEEQEEKLKQKDILCQSQNNE